jgi:pimeloyl-ACP methyl ester carboxylesterase
MPGFSQQAGVRDDPLAMKGSLMFEANDLMIPGPAGRLSVRTKGLENRPEKLVVLVQGANLSGQIGYDFSFDGRSDYSLMEILAARGFGAVTFAVRGYQKSELNDHPHSVQTDQAIEDTACVVDWLVTQGFAKPHMLGWSWGGRIVARYAEDAGARLDRVILMDPALGGGNRIPFPDKQDWWLNTAAYFRNRLEREFMEAVAHEQLAIQAEANELKAPNGIRIENERGSISPIPEKLQNPTLMLYGAAAGQQNYMQGGISRSEFFERLPTPDKQLVIVPDGGDYGHIQNARGRMYRVIAEFLEPQSDTI